MNLFDLAAKITLDSSEYEKGVENARGGIGKLSAWTVAKGQMMADGIRTGFRKILDIGKYAAQAGASFEAQMSKVGAISGATGEDFDKLTQKAKQLGIDTKFSATEAGQAFEYMAMAGWKSEEMLNGVSGIMDLAAASGEDLALVSDIVTDAMTAFGLSADKSTHFADVLAKASSNSNTNVAMMGETFKYVAPVAGSLGYSIEDTATAIGLMANAGIKSSQAGTSLRSMLTRLTKPTKEVSEAAEALGISLSGNGSLLIDNSGKMRDFSSVIEVLRDRFSGLSEAEKAETAAKLAGQEAMSGLLAIVNASDADFKKLTENINNADGAAQQMAGTMMDNLSGQITLFKSSAEGFGIALYDHIQTPLKDLVSVAIETTNNITDALTEGGVSGMMAAVGETFTALFDGIAERTPQILEKGAEVLLFIGKGIVSAAPKLATSALKIVSAFLHFIDSNATTIIRRGFELLGDFAFGIIDAIPGMVAKLPAVISALSNFFIRSFPVFVTKGAELLGKLIAGILGAIPQIAVQIPTVITALVDAFKAGYEQLKNAGSYLLEGMWNGISNKIEWLKGKVGGVVEIIKGWFTGKDGFDEHSPSKWSNQVFRYVMEGGALGMEAGTPALMRSVDRSVDRVKAHMDYGAVSIPYSQTAMGRHTAAMADTIMAAAPAGGGVYHIHVNVDGHEMAETIFDPLRGVVAQRGYGLA